MRYRILITAALVAGAACNEDSQPAALVGPPPMEATGVRAYVVQEPGGATDRVTLTVHVDSKSLGVAAYQGRLSFDPGAFELIEATTPDDNSRIVNSTTTAEGYIRFAGFAAEKFDGTLALRLVVRPIKPLDAANMVASLEVVGEATGVAVAKEKLITQRGIFTKVAAQIQ